jgi:hypothetical protein
MQSLHREIKTAELRRAWRRDPDAVLERYRRAAAAQPEKQLSARPAIEEMLEAIIRHESAELLSGRMLRSIAA